MEQFNEYSIAVHEAGHAVMSVIYGRKVEYVTIVPSGKALGECRNGEEIFDKNEPNEMKGIRRLKEVLVLLAGTAAESLLLGTNLLGTRGKTDFEEAEKIFDELNDGQGKERSNIATKMAWDLFRTPLAQQQIKAVANALMEHKTLTGSQVAEIMNAETVVK